jgi:hypothetical protein
MLAPLGLPAHAVTASSYLAAVSPGQYASYEPVKAVYQSTGLSNPEPQNLIDFNRTVSAIFTVETLSSPARNVTLQEVATFNNGTSPQTSAYFVDLLTGDGNASDTLIAGDLMAPDQIYNNASAASINQTLTMTYLGAARQVNLYNYTLSASFGVSTSFVKLNEIWDQASGILLELVSYTDLSTPSGTLYENLDVVITGTNIFATGTAPDFGLAATPTSITTMVGTAGTATISITAHNGFNGAVSLTVSATGLTCTLSPTSLATGSSTSTLSCSGSAGTYTVTITATSGSLSHTAQVPVKVTSVQQTPSAPASTILGLAPVIFYSIIGAIIAIIAAATVLTLRMRKKPTGTPPPTPTA